ncbi:probable sensor protein, similar to CitA [Alteracholeplasma palmae J233]|uniref:Probable sensor protein, similar to CitA n=1 Tax=Alteracholeplasma palmae (strain ATCC 49389 / J233) TaxID=1318466 RepID=U4KKQ2_ALTPJ|nr:sensor histidine kinase [Alteracholeplasma palmae]CCV64242.1 probable sensor protein, similar to CitA [Alteracholeplasma palmae J233]
MGFIIGFIVLFIYFRKNFKVRKQHWYEFLLAGIIFTIYSALVYYIDFGFYTLILILTVHISVYYLAIGMRWIEAFFSGILMLFAFYSTRGIILSSYALINNTSIHEIAISSNSLLISHIASITGFLLIFAIVKIIKTENLILLFSIKKQTIFLTFYVFIEVGYIYVVNQGKYIFDSNLWYSLTYLFTSILSIALFGYISNNIIRLIKAIETEIYTNRLEEQLDMQITHYKQYQSHVKELAKFKHDYYNIMQSLQHMIAADNKNEAISFIQESIGDDTFKSMPIIEKTSNSFIVDSIIFDYSNKCKQNNIKFDSDLRFPNSINFTQLELMKIFSNILSNALDASVKSKEDKRFISITTKAVSNWLVIKITNNYETPIVIENNHYITSKSDRILHGFGIKIVDDIITKKGGMSKLLIDKNSKIFSIQLSIPKTTNHS